jgi:hypothetical protein
MIAVDVLYVEDALLRLPALALYALVTIAAYSLFAAIRTYDTIGELVLPYKGVERGGKHRRLLEQLGKEV